MLFVTVGYRLISLDARTGLVDPAFGVNGVVDLRQDDDQEMNLLSADIGLHSTPLVTRDTVVVGAAHAGSGSPRVRDNVNGFVRAFDVRTGRRKWIFHTVPRKGEFGYESWDVPDQADHAGNTGVWAEMSADEALGLVYIGVELPTGDEVGIYRKGDALFGQSIVALDIETGERRWHFQMVHHGVWDGDVPCAALLCDIPVKGKTVKALAQPSKESFLYVLNRETGKPIWPIPERKVPKGDVPGEFYSPTQPIPSKPPPYDRQGCTEADLIDFTPELKARALAIASHYRMGPLFTPPALSRPEGPWGTLCLPSFQGGANWPGGAYDPETSLVYVYSKTLIDASGIGKNPDSNGTNFEYVQTVFNEATAADIDSPGRDRFASATDGINDPIRLGLISIEGLPLNKPPYGRITAIDLKTGTIAWQIAHGETPDHIRNHRLLKGVTIPRTGQSGIIAPVLTKTLVICGDSGVFTDDQGRKGARLRAYDKLTGEERGAVFMPAPQTGAPITYVRGGRQYVVIAVASGRYSGEFVAYRLPAPRRAPAAPPAPARPQPD